MSWERSDWIFGVALMCLLVAAGGCERSGSGHPAVETAFTELQAKPVSSVIARVDGRPISAEEFVASRDAQAQANHSDDAEHSAGAPVADAVMEKLIERELLASEAIKRGYQSHKTLQLVRKQAMVQRLLAQDVEDSVEAEDLDEAALKKVEAQLRERVGHPPGLEASHLLVSVPPGAQKDASNEQIDAWFVDSKEWLAVMRDDLPATPTVQDLFEVRDRYRDKLPAPLELHVNAHLVFPIGAFIANKNVDEKGEARPLRYGQDMPKSWHPVVSKFGQAATDLARQKKFGHLSDPVKTKFGWHLVMAEKLYPGEVPDASQVRQVAVAARQRQERREQLVTRMKKWMSDATVETFPQIIAQAHDTQN